MAVDFERAPFLVLWEVTRACALACVHCRADAIATRDPLEESEQLFSEKAFSDPENARQEAVRGTFDPGCLFYSFGKLMILKLRDDWRASHPGSSLRDFHDAFLSYGSSPVTLVRKAMLGEADDGKLSH